MSTFHIRLLDGPDDRFAYYDDAPEQAGSEPHEVTGESSEHDLADLDRVMSMLAWRGYRFEVRGLTAVHDPITGHSWGINPKARKGTSPQQLHDDYTEAQR